jgi:hypothetical protein
MTQAIFGLLGVLIGGLLNGTIASRQGRRAQSDAVRAAARLLYGQLDAAWTEVDRVARADVSDDRRMANLKAWDDYEELFARALSTPDWLVLHDAVVQLRKLDSSLPYLPEDPMPLNGNARQQIVEVRVARDDSLPIVLRLLGYGTQPSLRERAEYARRPSPAATRGLSIQPRVGRSACSSACR